MFTLGMLAPFMLFAQAGQLPITGTEKGKFVSPISFHSTAEVLNAFFKILIQIGAVAVTLAIVYAGFLFVVARGNPEQLSKAKETLKWTIIGALILLGAQVIAKAIENTIKTISS
jgi:hypothetical protein